MRRIASSAPSEISLFRRNGEMLQIFDFSAFDRKSLSTLPQGADDVSAAW